jgi:hypothetical protein
VRETIANEPFRILKKNEIARYGEFPARPHRASDVGVVTSINQGSLR